jgi:hypothetical protein
MDGLLRWHQIVVLTDIGDIDEVYDLDCRGRHTTQLPRQRRRNLNGMTGSSPPDHYSIDEIGFLRSNSNEGILNHHPNVVQPPSNSHSSQPSQSFDFTSIEWLLNPEKSSTDST